MMRLFPSLVLLLLVSSTFGDTSQQWEDCGAPLNSRVTFRDFTLFPNPARVNQNVHLRTITDVLDTVITKATLHLTVRHESQPEDEPLMVIPNINLCTLTSSIKCPILKGENIISFDWTIPQIAPGEYTLTLTLAVNATPNACLMFSLTVQDPSSDGWYTSWYEAVLTAPAHYEKANINDRTIGDFIQVGPHGYFNKALSGTFQWGRITSIKGSEDLVPPYLDTSHYIWGLSGNMTTKVVHTGSGFLMQHIYEGDFFVGYIGPLGIYNAPDDSLFSGTFDLIWSWNATTGRTALNGNATVVDPSLGTLPPRWPVPLTFGRLNGHEVITDENGILRIRASRTYCAAVEGCLTAAPPGEPDDYVFSDQDLGLTIGLILGFAFLVVLVVAALLYMRHKRAIEQEASVFDGRKGIYGDALIVDDIIQESKEYSRSLLPPVNPTKMMADYGRSEDSSYDSEPRIPPRGGRGRSNSPSSRSRSRTPSGTESSYSSHRSRSSSISPAGRGSPSRSRSRTRSISGSDYSSGQESASDSSRSRSRDRSGGSYESGSEYGSGTETGSDNPRQGGRQ